MLLSYQWITLVPDLHSPPNPVSLVLQGLRCFLHPFHCQSQHNCWDSSKLALGRRSPSDIKETTSSGEAPTVSCKHLPAHHWIRCNMDDCSRFQVAKCKQRRQRRYPLTCIGGVKLRIAVQGFNFSQILVKWIKCIQVSLPVSSSCSCAIESLRN